MTQAICRSCIEDSYVRAFIDENGSKTSCDQCGGSEDLAVSVQQLGKFIEPVMRQNFVAGEPYKVFHGDLDRGDWVQRGEDTADTLQKSSSVALPTEY